MDLITVPTAFYLHPNHARHAQPGHPERPARLEAIAKHLQQTSIWNALTHLSALPATREDPQLVHTSEYLDRLETAVAYGGAQLDPDTYTTASSCDTALEGLGGLLAITKHVLEGQSRNGFAATRPPGHHAIPTDAMGFCLFSNVAIAARWAQHHYGLKHIAIVDFDVHHGNGTQAAFYNDPNVLFVSLHQDRLYPQSGHVFERGTGSATGTTINIPLPARTGDTGYLAAFDTIVHPLLHRFRPEALFVSAGYDAHWLDPLSNMHVTTQGFGKMMTALQTCADTCCEGRLIAVLEGGYDTDALAYGVAASLHRLLDSNAEITDLLGPAPAEDTDVSSLLADLAVYHKAF